MEGHASATAVAFAGQDARSPPRDKFRGRTISYHGPRWKEPPMITDFVLVSGNKGKIAEARLAAGADLPAAELDLPEIQSLDMLEILRGKAAAAWETLRRPVVAEEAGLELAALNGFPGPLVKWML